MAHRPPTCPGSSCVDRAELYARSTVEPVSGPGSEVDSAASSGKSHATSALSIPQSHPLMPRSAPVLVDTASGDGTPSRQPTCRRLGPPSVTTTPPQRVGDGSFNHYSSPANPLLAPVSGGLASFPCCSVYLGSQRGTCT